MLYLGENTDTVARETRLIVQDKDGNDVAHPQAPTIIMTVEYELQRVTDLTDPKMLELLVVKASSLVTEWTEDLRTGKVPLTQVLRAAAHAVGLEGLIVPSMRHPGRANIAVIEANLFAGSYIQIHNPVGFGPAVTTRIDGTK